MAPRRDGGPVAGKRMYLWRAVNHEGEVLDVLVQHRRNKRLHSDCGRLDDDVVRVNPSHSEVWGHKTRFEGQGTNGRAPV